MHAVSCPILRGKEVKVVLRRMLFILLAAVLLTTVTVSLSFAQSAILPRPEAGVRGTGAIALPNHGKNVGLFNINVAKYGTVLVGGFRYVEVGPTSSAPVCVIFSRMITGLTFNGNNYAKVTAVGYWNGMLSDITVMALDDNPSGDNFHITAKPRSPLTIIYDEGGGLIKGDLVVYNNAPTGAAKGAGTIQVNKNIGKFAFTARNTLTGPTGNVYYVEFSPTATSVVVRPPVVIYLAAIGSLDVTGFTATIKGRGTFNGMPAAIVVTAVDNSMLMGPMAKPDWFSIKAVTLPGPTLMPTYQYSAEGPLTTGDIVVVP